MDHGVNTLEEVCGVDNGEDKDSWQVDSKDGVEDPTPEDNHQLDPFVKVLGINVV